MTDSKKNSQADQSPDQSGHTTHDDFADDAESIKLGGSEVFSLKDQNTESGKIQPKSSKLTEWLTSRFDRPAASGLVFAGFWYRIAAFLIDFPLSLMTALAVLGGIQILVPAEWLGPINTVGGNTAAMLIIQGAYFIFFERSNWKSTPGKRFFKLRVTDKRGIKLSWKDALIRTVSKLSIPLTFGVVVVWIFFSQKSQTLYDKITSTLVLRKSNESFLPSFLPNSVHRFHWIIVIVFSLSMAFFAMRATVVVMMPRVDLITLKVMINESLKDLSPAQRVIEEAILKNGKPPETIDASLFSRTANRRHIYLAGNGNITVLFSQGSLNGRGLIISPAQDQKTKEIIWSCAAINLPAELTPNSCAPTPVPVAKRGI